MSCVPRLLLFFVPFFGTAISAHAEYYPDQRPPRPDCYVTHCVPISNGYRHGRRCFWRCPPQPPKPNCILVGCNDAFEDGRSGQRCQWRCPRDEPEPQYAEPDSYRNPPTYTTPSPDPSRPPVKTTPTLWPQIAAVNISPETSRAALFIAGWLIMCLVGFGIVAAIVAAISSRLAVRRHRRDEVMQHTAAAEDLNKRLADIARETDRFITQYRSEQYQRGWRDGDGT